MTEEKRGERQKGVAKIRSEAERETLRQRDERCRISMKLVESGI